MAPKGWVAEDQSTFLLDLWNNIMAEWNRRWPVIDTAFPGQNLKLEDLNEEQLEIYNKALEKVRKRVKQWVFWRFNQRGRQVAGGATAKDLHNILATSGGRLLKDYEMYVKVVAEGFDEYHNEACGKMGLAGRQKIQLWHTNAKAFFEMASSEEREAVAARMLEQEEIKNNLKTTAEKENLTPTQHQHFLNILPGVLSATVDPAVRKAGVMAFVCVIGPVPKEGGKIVATSYQFGDQKDTPLFASTWDKYDQVFTNELGNFARRHLFSKEACARRALPDSQKSEDLDAAKCLEDAPAASPSSLNRRNPNGAPSDTRVTAPQKDTSPHPTGSGVSPSPIQSSEEKNNPQSTLSGSLTPHPTPTAASDSGSLPGPQLYLPDKLPLSHPDFSASCVGTYATQSNSASSLVPNFAGIHSWQFDFDNAPWADPVTLEAMANGMELSNAPTTNDFLPNTPSLSIPTLDSGNRARHSDEDLIPPLRHMDTNSDALSLPPPFEAPNSIHPGFVNPHVQPLHNPSSSMSWTNTSSRPQEITPIQEATAMTQCTATTTNPTVPTPHSYTTATPPTATTPQPLGTTRLLPSTSTPPHQPSAQTASTQPSAKTAKPTVPAPPIPPVQSAI